MTWLLLYLVIASTLNTLPVVGYGVLAERGERGSSKTSLKSDPAEETENLFQVLGRAGTGLALVECAFMVNRAPRPSTLSVPGRWLGGGTSV